MGRYVVIGANGGTGYQIAAQLTRAGNDVIAVVRNPGSASAELKALTTQVKKLTARVEALERLLQRIIQQKPVSERQLERALRVMRRSENASVR